MNWWRFENSFLQALGTTKNGNSWNSLIKGLCEGREKWWTTKAKTLEVAAEVGNTMQLLRLAKDTGIRKSVVGEAIFVKGEHVIYSARKLNLCAGHSRKQFKWHSSYSLLTDYLQTTLIENRQCPSTLNEIEKALSNLKRGKAVRHGKLALDIIKDGGSVVMVRLTNILTKFLEINVILFDWSRTLIVQVCKSEQKSCNNEGQINLTNVVCKLLTSVIIRRLSDFTEVQTRKNLSGFRPRLGYIDSDIHCIRF